MSSCNLGGVLEHKLINFHPELWKIRNAVFVTPSTMNCIGIGTSWGLRGVRMGNRPAAYRRPWRVTNSLALSCLSSEKENGADNLEEKQNNKVIIVPSSSEVHSLLTTICDTTSIAEFELKIAGFRVYVKRDLVEEITTAPSPSLPIAASTNTSNQTPEVNGSASASSLVISKPKRSIQSILETASDEGLVILQSPKVGFFRKSRTIKGKKAPPSCKEKQEVKEGQVLCFIEQLGAEIPIESDVSGEIIKILRADGEPVGYGDALIAILPSFPGIKKLQ